jgi:hypothetical protein
VEVLDSGTLALSSGRVRDPQGTRVGTFNSVWRRASGGRWKIVFDKGCTCRWPGRRGDSVHEILAHQLIEQLFNTMRYSTLRGRRAISTA